MESKQDKRVTAILSVSIVALLLLVAYVQRRRMPRWLAGSGSLVEVDSGRLMLMGTFAEVKLRCLDRAIGRIAQDGAMAALEDVDRLMNTYRDDSELSTVNQRGAIEAVPVSPETYLLLQRAIDYSELTGGAFDITVGPLLAVWKQAAKEGSRPSDEELSRVRELVGCRLIEIANGQQPRVRLARAGVSVNVNAIAKGYAVDRALQAVRLPGVVAALVNIGGEIACFGEHRPGQPWRVGIQDPFSQDNDNPLSERSQWRIRLRDCAVATSGNYRQYVEISGERFSHIVDPRTGEPAAKLPSVTVIAPKAEDADALATAISVMGPEQGMKLVESLPDVEAMLVAGTEGEQISARGQDGQGVNTKNSRAVATEEQAGAKKGNTDTNGQATIAKGESDGDGERIRVYRSSGFAEYEDSAGPTARD